MQRAPAGGAPHSADLRFEYDAPPESAGIGAVFDGIRDARITDDERLARGFVVCDALFAYCRGQIEA